MDDTQARSWSEIELDGYTAKSSNFHEKHGKQADKALPFVFYAVYVFRRACDNSEIWYIDRGI